MTNSTLETVARAIADNMIGVEAEDCWYAAFAALQSLRQVDDETVEAMAAEQGWRGLNRTRDTANLAGRGFKSIVQAILTEGGEG